MYQKCEQFSYDIYIFKNVYIYIYTGIFPSEDSGLRYPGRLYVQSKTTKPEAEQYTVTQCDRWQAVLAEKIVMHESLSANGRRCSVNSFTYDVTDLFPKQA